MLTLGESKMSLLAARSRLPSGCPAARRDGAQKHVSVRRSHASCSSISEGEQRARHSYSSPDGRVPVPPQRQHEWQPKIGSLVASRPVLAHTQAMAMRCGHCGGQHESVADVRECSGENTDPSFSSTPPVDQGGRLLCSAEWCRSSGERALINRGPGNRSYRSHSCCSST